MPFIFKRMLLSIDNIYLNLRILRKDKEIKAEDNTHTIVNEEITQHQRKAKILEPY